MTATTTLAIVTVTNLDGKVRFHATEHCILKFDNTKMFGIEFLELHKNETRTLTYLEETELYYTVFIPPPEMETMSRPTGPIVTP